MTTSGSAAYRYDWTSGEIVHRNGRRWWPRPRLQRLYAALDACRGEALTAERLRESLWASGATLDNVKMSIRRLRQLCGREIVETVPLWIPPHGGPSHCGYLVRSG